MNKVDYIIVGCGLAGITFCETLIANNKTFVVFDNGSQQSSIVAAGLYNPVILKRFTRVWKANEQLSIALPMYAKIEKRLNIKIDYKLRILRRLASIEEQNKWFSASDKPGLESYLSTKLIKNSNDYIDTPFDQGEVYHAGRLDTETLIATYKEFLKSKSLLCKVSFQYNALLISDDKITYNDLCAQHIVFAEGFGVKQNPYFNYVPINGTKGEVLTIKAPRLKIDYALKSSVFVIPLGNDLYTIGSTYNWDDKTNTPTLEAKTELITKLKTFINCDFEIIDHKAGIRPTVKDRRPLVGQHFNYKSLYILNGLGTRGVMIAPYVSNALYEFIEKGIPLDEEIEVNRFS